MRVFAFAMSSAVSSRLTSDSPTRETMVRRQASHAKRAVIRKILASSSVSACGTDGQFQTARNVMQSSSSPQKARRHCVCPWWFGYLLLSPIRRLRYDPSPILAPYLREGMTVLEPVLEWDSSRSSSPVGSDLQA